MQSALSMIQMTKPDKSTEKSENKNLASLIHRFESEKRDQNKKKRKIYTFYKLESGLFPNSCSFVNF